MKLYIKEGVLCAEAETMEDVQRLMFHPVAVKETQIKRKRGRPRKAMYRVHECPDCNKSFKMLKLHRTRTHEGNNWGRHGRAATPILTDLVLNKHD